LFTFSFYLNSRMSFLTEKSYIMLSLYIRGFAMGLIFTPISSAALLDLPRSKMAQASGLTNTIRQLGGSLGVAILTTILVSRVNYHNQIYGQEINPHSVVFNKTVSNITASNVHTAGSSYSDGAKQGQYLLLSNITKQAYIQGIDDDFLIAAVMMLVGGIPVLFLKSKKKFKKKNENYEVPEM
jgi:MFS transporter, DHA2 family, multidrug resistance protein